jgi:outer membrane protein assembly factor BamA
MQNSPIRVAIRLLLALVCTAVVAQAQCANDNRDHKKGGILVTDFTITGTQTLSATELAQITGEFTGSCFNDDSDEMGERVRALFQNEGYFKADVKNVTLKPTDPLGSPKPVTMEADVAEGPQFRLGQITFLENHAFSSARLRNAFPLKKGDVFARNKIASGLESVRKLYTTHGYLDMFPIPDTSFATAATLKITVTEGPQYHMGKLEILAEKQLDDRLRLAWKLDEGTVFDLTYIDKYIQENHDLLPDGFGRDRIQLAKDCPEAVVAVRLKIGDKETAAPMKDVPCEKKDDQAK